MHGHGAHVEVGGKLLEVRSLLPPRRLQGENASHLAWGLIPSRMEPSHQPWCGDPKM